MEKEEVCTLLWVGWYCKQVIGQDVCGKIPIVLIGKQEVVDLKDKLDKEDLKTSRWTCSRPQDLKDKVDLLNLDEKLKA